MCRRIAGNDADAADATQEALILLVRRLDRYDGRASFGTWAYRVATNACLDELRRRKRRPAPMEPDDLGPLPDTSGEGRIADAVAARLDVDAAMAQLPDDFRAAVALRDLAGLDYAAIADILDIAPGTVRSRIARGRSALAELVGGNQSTSTARPRSDDQ